MMWEKAETCCLTIVLGLIALALVGLAVYAVKRDYDNDQIAMEKGYRWVEPITISGHYEIVVQKEGKE